MAQIRTTLGGVQSGSLGGNVFGRSRSGAVLRVRTGRTKAPTAGQQKTQSALASAANAWGRLSQTQRQGWNQWANSNPLPNTLGQERAASGFAEFCRTWVFNQLGQTGTTQLDAPTAIGRPAVSNVKAEIITVNPSVITLIFSGDGSPTNDPNAWGILVFCSRTSVNSIGKARSAQTGQMSTFIQAGAHGGVSSFSAVFENPPPTWKQNDWVKLSVIASLSGATSRAADFFVQLVPTP